MTGANHPQCCGPKGGEGYLSIFRRADDVTRAMSKGGACECPRGGLSISWGRMTSRGQCPGGGGGGACECRVLHPHLFQEILIRACNGAPYIAMWAT